MALDEDIKRVIQTIFHMFKNKKERLRRLMLNIQKRPHPTSRDEHYHG